MNFCLPTLGYSFMVVIFVIGGLYLNYITRKSMKNNPIDDTINSSDNASKEPVSAKNIPLALGCIMDDVAEIKNKVDFLMQHLGMGAAGLKPVTIKEAATFLSVSESKIRKMIREHNIPYYERNGKKYFFEKELLEWVKESRVATIDEQLHSYNLRQRRR